MKSILLFLIPIIVLVGLNYRQLYSVWAIRNERERLGHLAVYMQAESQNPQAMEDGFDSELSTDFWKFSIINGAGKASHSESWHAASFHVGQGLFISHIAHPDFESETINIPDAPADARYNNVTLIGGSGFRPTPSSDVVLRFSANVSNDFYGTAGVIFQPVDTLSRDGMFVKPFDMFGFSVAGQESSIRGVNGPLCYLALNWIPVDVQALQVDAQTIHDYEIHLRWATQKEWQGIIRVDGVERCRMPVPAFGPVEVHVWSDNALVEDRPRRWWEIAPSMDLKFQDGGEKQFYLDGIQILAEAR